MEISEPTALGGRTRAAKTLALKRLNSDFSATNHEASTLAGGSSYYLQLRIRRLEKPPMLGQLKQLPRHHKSGIEESGSTNLIKSFTAASCLVRVTLARTCNSDQGFGDIEINNMSAEASFGENNVYFELQRRPPSFEKVRLVNDVSPMGDYSFAKYNKATADTNASKKESSSDDSNSDEEDNDEEEETPNKKCVKNRALMLKWLMLSRTQMPNRDSSIHTKFTYWGIARRLNPYKVHILGYCKESCEMGFVGELNISG